MRAGLVRTHPFGPPPPVPPDWTTRIGELIESACFVGVQEALLEVGRFGAAHDNADAAGISGLSTQTVCPNAELKINGTFAASQPADTDVYLPSRDGSCNKVDVKTWTDRVITVVVPDWIGAGCVGFVRRRDIGGFDGISQVSGALTQCFGAVGQIWGAAFDKVQRPVTSCPPCLPGGANRINLAGRPIVNWFTCTPEVIEPGERPRLSWNVQNATSISIDVVTAGAPPLAVPSPGFAGTMTWPPVTGTSVETTGFILRAQNSCGTTLATAKFTLTRRPRLSITRIEVVQGEQLARQQCSPGRQPAYSRQGLRRQRDHGRVQPGRRPRAGRWVGPVPVRRRRRHRCHHELRKSLGSRFLARPTADRDILGHSANFDVPLSACAGRVRFHATAMLPAPMSTHPVQTNPPPLAFADGSTTVTFNDRQQQLMLPLLLVDPMSAGPTPTRADFDALLEGAYQRQPFPTDGIKGNPEITLTLDVKDSLSATLGWERLILKLGTMNFLFGKDPVGGIRAAIAPADAPPSTRGGMAWPRIGALIPCLINKVGMQETFAHELGHAYGLLHVNCNGAAGPYDGGLPLTLGNPAVDVVDRRILPTGSNELMGYCSSRWPSRQHWDKMFDSIPVS